MKKRIIFLSILIAGISIVGLSYSFNTVINATKNSKILAYQVNPRKANLQFYSTDENGNPFENHGKLQDWLDKKAKKLIFGMNGGMYKKDLSPVGLYIENGVEKMKIDSQATGYGNFYLQPNGIFYLNNKNEAKIVVTQDFEKTTDIKQATQSGPMLIINGNIHPKFNETSKNINIRNGVGILPNGNLLFAMSKEPINFYHFANYFKSNNCKNALYLDGYVSETYLPSKDWKQENGRYGMIIAELE